MAEESVQDLVSQFDVLLLGFGLPLHLLFVAELLLDHEAALYVGETEQFWRQQRKSGKRAVRNVYLAVLRSSDLDQRLPLLAESRHVLPHLLRVACVCGQYRPSPRV